MACAPSPSLGGFVTTEIEVGNESLTVAIAGTTSERSQGLRGVEKLPDGLDGMLFVFEQARPATFGMRETLISLDIWWFDSERTLIGSTEMQPCLSSSCPSFPSPGEVAWALETPLGQRGFASGEILTLPADP